MPFTGIRHSTNGHFAVFHRILPRQGRVDARALARGAGCIDSVVAVSYTHLVTGLLAIMIDAPGFIKEHHSDDARMVVVAVEHALQSLSLIHI